MNIKLSDAILSMVHAFSDKDRKDLVRLISKKVKMLEDELKDIRDNWDCDKDAHRYNTCCRCCYAKKVLEESQLTKEDYGL